MYLLGSLGRMYMFILLVLLFLGAGFALWQLVDFLHEKLTLRQNSQPQSSTKQNGVITKLQSAVSAKVKGGKFDMTNNWLKLAVFSLVGIVISVMVLGFLSASNSQGMQPAMANMNGAGLNMNGGTNMATPVGNMQVAGGMNGYGLNGYGINGYGNMGMNTNANMMMQLNQMQMMINQMQQQMTTMNSMNSGMNNNMNSGSSMGMMNMGMSGSSNMNSSSSGSMGGMM